MITKMEIAEKMKKSIINIANDKDVDLLELDFTNTDTLLSSIDTIFNDGGEVRCEKFGDIAFEYALQFGELEDDNFENARWECIEEAFLLLKTHFTKVKELVDEWNELNNESIDLLNEHKDFRHYNSVRIQMDEIEEILQRTYDYYI